MNVAVSPSRTQLFVNPSIETAGVKPAPTPAPASAIDKKAMIGLLGFLLAALLSGLNNRAGALGLDDISGALGFSSDGSSWLDTFYSAGELLAMPFATWLAVTFTPRRFFLAMLTMSAAIAVILPFVVNIQLLYVLRGVQGFGSGALIPLLMMMALRTLPPSIRLHGLALYAMTATLAPNVAIWIVGRWTDGLSDWRWLYWQFVPIAAVAGALVAWALPREPINWQRFSTVNATGALFDAMGLFLLTIGLDQGNRLDWFQSPLIKTSLLAGFLSLAAYVVSEWFHPAPFIKLQLLARRNLHLGFVLFVMMLVAFMSAASVPALFLTANWGYRATQNAPIGLIVGLPQFFAGSLVAILLYQKWADARVILAAGLVLVGTASLLAARVDPSWIWRQFVPAEILQAIGQPMAVVSLLFLTTSSVQPFEGPYVSGFVNTLRSAGILIAGALIGRVIEVRENFHLNNIVDRFGTMGHSLPAVPPIATLSSMFATQALAMSVADLFHILGFIALGTAPLALLMKFTPAPDPRAIAAKASTPAKE